MSIEQLNLAFKAGIQKAATKFVLVALADYANEAGEAYPTIETITAKTSLNRKTIISALTDTGMVRGKTGQVKVWKLQLKPSNERVPKTGHLDKAKKQPMKESQKRNSTENGTVPFFPRPAGKGRAIGRQRALGYGRRCFCRRRHAALSGR